MLIRAGVGTMGPVTEVSCTGYCHEEIAGIHISQPEVKASQPMKLFCNLVRPSRLLSMERHTKRSIVDGLRKAEYLAMYVSMRAKLINWSVQSPWSLEYYENR